MNRTELLGLLAGGENARVAFHRDGVPPERLARDLSALLNFRGGKILFGVADDGGLSGLARSREDFGAWVRGVAGRDLQPRVVPRLEFVELDGRVVGVVGVPAYNPDTPYRAKQDAAWVTFTRAGSASRAATRAQEERLYRTAGVVRYDLDPVPGAGPERLDRKRLEHYFGTVLGQPMPAGSDREAWLRRLADADFLRLAADGAVATTPGWLAFGKESRRGPRQAGIVAAAYPGRDQGTGPTAAEVIRGPLVPLFAETPRGAARAADRGVIDRAVDFASRNLDAAASQRGARRARGKALPMAAVREAIVNAVAHRDYALADADIEVSLYQDRLEVTSPGGLPDGVTAASMRKGARAARNGRLIDVLRDYGYVAHRGLGVPRRLVEAMRAHNGTEPDLLEAGDDFVARLWKSPA